jgi:hypothetical protein
MFKRWIYSATKAPKIINDSDFEELYHLGWRDTPAAFLKLETLGIEKDDTEKAQQALDMVQGVVDSLNGQLNFNSMKKKALTEHAKEHFNVELDQLKSLKVLRKQVNSLYDNSTTDS